MGKLPEDGLSGWGIRPPIYVEGWVGVKKGAYSTGSAEVYGFINSRGEAVRAIAIVLSHLLWQP